MTLTQRIKAHAVELGFDLVGVAEAGPSQQHAAYLAWLRAGFQGTMGYLARPDAVERRRDPRTILPGARSVVAVAMSYYVPHNESPGDDTRPRGRVARYARHDDYHHVMTRRLEELVDFVRAQAGREIQARVYVDTGPLLERELASRAGLGWIGKHTNLIHPRWGSWLLLGEVLTDLPLDPDPPFERDHCGSCNRCLVACPTGAFVAPRVLDARRCISYLTIELKGSIPPDLRPLMGDWVFGCDLCQEVCPWNQKFARPTGEPAFHPRDDLAAPDLIALLSLDEEGFRRRFRGSPIRRARRQGLLRNVAVVLGNLGAPAAVPALARALHDPQPVVREHAAWALARIGGGAAQPEQSQRPHQVGQELAFGLYLLRRARAVKLRELASRVVIDPRKLTEYALNPDAARGRHKALVFQRTLGYTPENYQHLLRQIETQAPDVEVHFHSQDEFGCRYTADLQIEGPASQRAIVRTGWFVPEGEDEVRLATLWVKGKAQKGGEEA